MDEIKDIFEDEKVDTAVLTREIINAGSEEILCYLDDFDVSVPAKNEMLSVAIQCLWVDVVIRLSSQQGFGILVAKEVFSETNQNKLNDIKRKYNINDLSDERNIRSYGKLFSDKDLLFWFFGILFSKRFSKALYLLLRDKDKKVRLRAIEALELFEGDDIKGALEMAFDDTSSENAKCAKSIYESKYGLEMLQDKVAIDKGVKDRLVESASSIKGLLGEFFSNINPMALFKTWSTTFNDIGDNAKKTADDMTGVVKGKFTGMFKKERE